MGVWILFLTVYSHPFNSGPVTAGVLRGEKSRFQLFGDTMNTAARMESNGQGSKIHMSSETAELLMASGKQSWIRQREDKIVAKGKGELTTFWLELGSLKRTESHYSEGASVSGCSDVVEEIEIGTVSEEVPEHPGDIVLPAKTLRLVEWNASCLLQKLKEVVVKRGGDVETEITEEVSSQLTHFVKATAQKYHENPFHNFEHASHVTMSVTKLLSRVVTQDDDCAEENFKKGIATDALMQFGIIVSALIHDVDHLGVPNAQLAIEKPDLASKYQDKSIAENNSISVAWGILMKPEFEMLRKCLAPNAADLEKFHDVVINATLATDIVDKDLKADRNKRWEFAFSESVGEKSDELKIRIVLEHLIQASDVCHTMQHWHIYRKWNERLFEEMYKAYREGRSAKDPSEFWYNGELGFFDFVSNRRGGIAARDVQFHQFLTNPLFT